MQGQKTVVLLAAMLAAFVAAGLWFGLDHGGAGDQGGAGVADPKGTESGGADRAAPPAQTGSLEEGAGGIEGRVLLLAGSEPVKDVMVRLAAPGDGTTLRTVTGPEGYFLFRGVPAGDGYELSLAHGEYAPVVRPGLPVVNGEITDVGVLHLERAVAFVVAVTDGGGAPIPGAAVDIYPWRGDSRRATAYSWMEYALAASRVPVAVKSAIAGEDGRAAFHGLPGGFYSIVAEAEGFARRGVNRMLAPEDEGTTVVVRLGAGFSLTGTVLDREGAPVRGKVLASPAAMNRGRDEALRRAGNIDEEGRYRLTRLQAGAVSLSVVPEGAPQVPAGSVEIPRLKVFDIRLGEVASLVGRVTNSDGDPVGGAEVRAMVSGVFGRSTAGGVGLTNDDGDYRIDGIPPGYLSALQALAGGYAPYPGPLDQISPMIVTPGAVLRRDVTLQRGARLTGRVTCARDKTPISGARITASPVNARWGISPVTATSGPDGAYAIEVIAPGEYSLWVLADGYYQARESGSPPPGMGVPGQGSGTRWHVTIDESAPVTTKDLVLDEGGVVSGVVVTSTGAPVANTQVRAAAGNGANATTTRADGTFEVRGLAPSEKMSVYAWQPGRVARSDTFALGPGEKVTGLRLVLQASARISGTVEIAGGGTPAGASVSARRGGRENRGWGGGVTAPVGAGGSFLLEDVAPGDLVVEAIAPGYPGGASDELTVAEGAEITGVRILVSRGLTLDGEVTGGDGGPVEGAGISISGRSMGDGFSGPGGGGALVAQTDAAGRFFVDGLKAGTYRVTATKVGYAAVSRTGVDPSLGELLRLQFETTGEISGTVVDEAGAPVSGIMIGVSKSGATMGSATNFQYRGTTSEDGTFRLTGVAQGTWFVSALPGWGSGQNYALATVEGVVPGGKPIVIEVRPGLSISGTVTGPDGRPLAGLNVYVRQAESRTYQAAVTKGDGSFEIPGLEPGTYRLNVQSRTPGLAGAGLDKVSAGASGLVLRLDTALAISGRVTDRAGVPVASAGVQARSVGGTGSFSRSGSTQATGAYTVSGLPPGAYDLTFTAAGRFLPSTLSGITSGSSGVDIQMDPGLTLSGILYLPGGQVAGGVSLAADRKGHPTIVARSDEGGRFAFGGLLDGQYRITVARSVGGYTLLTPYVAEAGTTDARIVLSEGLSIRGMVVDARGKGVPRAWVGLVSGRGSGTRADESGSFVILGLKEGEVKIRAYGAGRSSKPVDVRAGDQAALIRIE